MLQHRLLLLVLLMVSNFNIWSQASVQEYYAIGFYNVENLFDTIDNPMIWDEEFTPSGSKAWTKDKYNEKVANIASVISLIGRNQEIDGLSLLGLSEIENDTVIMDLISHPQLNSRNYGFVHHSSPDRRGIDVALVYDTTVFQVDQVVPYPVHMQFSDTSKVRRTRDVLLVSGRLDGLPLHITVNHWPSRSGGEKRSAVNRNIAATVNRRILDSLYTIDPEVRFVVMGDLNDDPDNASLVKHLRAARKLNKISGSEMYNPMSNLYNKGLGSNAYRDRWSLFDQIVVSAPFVTNTQSGLQFIEARIFNKNFLIERKGKYKGYPKRTFDFDAYQSGFSDHLPVYMVIAKSVTD